MKKLQMTFYNELNKKHRYTPKLAREDLTGEEVRTAMEGLVNLNIFEKNGIKHCTAIAGAKYVEVIETVLIEEEPLVRRR